MASMAPQPMGILMGSTGVMALLQEVTGTMALALMVTMGHFTGITTSTATSMEGMAATAHLFTVECAASSSLGTWAMLAACRALQRSTSMCGTTTLQPEQWVQQLQDCTALEKNKRKLRVQVRAKLGFDED